MTLFLRFMTVSCFCLISGLSIGQAGIYREADITEQSNFIEALALQFSEDFDQSIETLDELISASPDKAVLYYERARSYIALENFEKANSDIQKAIKFDAKRVSFHQLKYEIEGLQNNYDAQIITANRLIELEPSNIYNYYESYNSYLNAGKDDEALSILDKTIGVFGINESLANSRIKMLKSKGDVAGVTETLEKMIQDNPLDIEFRHRLADHLNLIGDKEAANLVYEEILQIQPDDATANVHKLKQSQAKGGTDVDAISALINNPDLPLDPKILELIPYIQNMSSDASDPKNIKTFTLIESLQKQYPNSAKVNSITADFFFNTTQFEKAAHHYEQTIALNDNVFEVWDQFMLVLFMNEDVKGLRKYSDKLIESFPNKIEGYQFHAMSYILDDDLEEASEYIMEGQLIAGKDEIKRQKNNMSKLFLSLVQEDLTLAGELANGLKNFAAQNPIASKLVGDYYSATGDGKEANKLWSQAYRLGFQTSQLKAKINAKG